MTAQLKHKLEHIVTDDTFEAQLKSEISKLKSILLSELDEKFKKQVWVLPHKNTNNAYVHPLIL